MWSNHPRDYVWRPFCVNSFSTLEPLLSCSLKPFTRGITSIHWWLRFNNKFLFGRRPGILSLPCKDLPNLFWFLFQEQWWYLKYWVDKLPHLTLLSQKKMPESSPYESVYLVYVGRYSTCVSVRTFLFFLKKHTRAEQPRRFCFTSTYFSKIWVRNYSKKCAVLREWLRGLRSIDRRFGIPPSTVAAYAHDICPRHILLYAFFFSMMLAR